MQAGDTYTTTEQRCKTVQESSTRTIGYDVTYRLAGQEGGTHGEATRPHHSGQGWQAGTEQRAGLILR